MIFQFLKHCSHKTPGPEVCTSLLSADPSTSGEPLPSAHCVREVQGEGKKPLEKREGCYQELSSNVIHITCPFKLDALGEVKCQRLDGRGVVTVASWKAFWAVLQNVDFLLQWQGVSKCVRCMCGVLDTRALERWCPRLVGVEVERTSLGRRSGRGGCQDSRVISAGSWAQTISGRKLIKGRSRDCVCGGGEGINNYPRGQGRALVSQGWQ